RKRTLNNPRRHVMLATALATQHQPEAPALEAPQFAKPHSLISIGDFLRLGEIQRLFDTVPLDPYVKEGFRRKSLFRARLMKREVVVSDHAPLYQPSEYNPVHGGIYRHYPAMDQRLAELLQPVVHLFAACANLGPRDEVLVQAQRITATDGQTGFPVVEGWHQDNIKVLGLLLIDRVNVRGGISLLSPDRVQSIALAQTLAPGDFLLVNDPVVWHNTTPIEQQRSDQPGYRDLVISSSP